MMAKSNTDHIVTGGMYPAANHKLLLRPSCSRCKRPFMGHVFQQCCERPECVDEKLKPKRNLKGQKRGTLTVKHLARVTANEGSFWRCKCDCGKVIVKSEAYLDSRRPTCGKGCPAA